MYGQGNFYPQIGQGPLRPPPPHQPHVGQTQPAAPAEHGQVGQLYLNPTPRPPPPPQNMPHVHSYSNTHQNIQWSPCRYNHPPQRGHHNLPPLLPFSPPPPPPLLLESGPSHSHSGRVADAENASLHDVPPPPLKPRDENIVRKIEVLCQYIVKNGPDFEDMTLKKERKNPEFDFLFGGEPGSEAELAHKYFLWVKMNLTNKLQGQKHDDPSSADSDMDMEDDITQAVEEQGVENKPFESPSVGSNLKESSTTHIDSIQVSREPVPLTDPSKPEHDKSLFRLVPYYDSDESSENLNETFLEDLSPTKADALSEEVDRDVQTHLARKSLDSSTELETVSRKPDQESSEAAIKSQKIEESSGGGNFKPKKAQRVDKFGRLIREGASKSEPDDARQRQNTRRDKRHRSRSRSRSRDRRSRFRDRRSRSRDRRSRSRSRRSRSRDRRRRSPRRRKQHSRSRSRSPRKRNESRSPYRQGNEFGGKRDKGQLPECFDFRRGKCYRGASCRYSHQETDKTVDYKSNSPYKEVPESNLSDLYEKDVIENVTPDRKDKSLITLVAESEKAQEVTEALDIENEIVEQQEQEQNNSNGTSWIQQSEPVHHNSDDKIPQMQNSIPNLPPAPTPPRNFNFYQQQPSVFYQPSHFSAPPNTSWQPPPLVPVRTQLGVFQPNHGSPYISNLPVQHQAVPQFGGPTNQLQQQNMSFLSQPAGRMQPLFGCNANSTYPSIPSHYNPYASTYDQQLNSKFSVNSTFNQEQAVPVESVGLKEQYDPFDSVEQSKSVQGINHEVNSDLIVRASGSNKPLNLEEKKHKEEENDEYGSTAGAVENGSPSEPIDDDETTTQPAGEVEIDKEGKSNNQGNNKSGKDSRSMKHFKNSLADFVKEVLKPSWRQGNMSKEAFKTIVKKTVDKVSGAMKVHQVPKSQSKINHYMDSNRRKLTKLVMCYVDKYVKS